MISNRVLLSSATIGRIADTRSQPLRVAYYGFNSLTLVFMSLFVTRLPEGVHGYHPLVNLT